MRLGLMLSGTRPIPETVAIAQRAEQNGFAEVWVSEDYFERGAFSIAAAVASSTRSIRIGVGVINPWTRHPMLTAMEFAGLNEIAEGRAVLGIGASNRIWIQDQCGTPFNKPLTAVEECTQIIRSALSGEKVSFKGQHFVVDATLSFTPEQNETCIYIGAKGPRALALTDHIGDGVLLSLLANPDYISWARQISESDIDTAAYVLAACSPNDRAVARNDVLSTLTRFLGVHGNHEITRLGGLEPERAKLFRELWLASEPAEKLIDDSIIDTFSVAGNVADCLDGLDRLAESGLKSAILRDPGDNGIEGLFSIGIAHQKHGGRF